MSGQEGGRGYAVQWVNSALDGLDDKSWTHCTFEPEEKSEKVDVLFETRDSGGKTTNSRAKQIKSSKNQFSTADARKIGDELKKSYPTANEYEVILVGPTAGGIDDLKEPAGVTYRVKSLDMDSMYKHAAQSIGLFLERLNRREPRASARDLIARALTTKISEWASEGKTVTRQEFTDLVEGWVEEAILDLPKEFAEEHDRLILRTVHKELPPQFVLNFLDGAYHHRPYTNEATAAGVSCEYLRQQRFVPRDKELANVIDTFLRDIGAILEFLGNYFSDERGILRFTPGQINLAERAALEKEYAALDEAAQRSHKDLVQIAQARWPELMIEFNQEG